MKNFSRTLIILSLALGPLSFLQAQENPVSEEDSLLWAFDSSNMVIVQGGTFKMGSVSRLGKKFEGPVHQVLIRPFYIDKYEVSNRDFKEFTDATGYITTAEKNKSSWCYSDSGWNEVKGADWRHPTGPKSSLSGKWDHPVGHVSWHDAQEFATWAHKRIPTEAEWEKAARGGLIQNEYPWGNNFNPRKANIRESNHLKTIRKGSYPQNAFGLYDMCGNVWEWTQDWFDKYYYKRSAVIDPKGGRGGAYKIMRGGGFFSHDENCRVTHRQAHYPNRTAQDFGFRCVAP